MRRAALVLGMFCVSAIITPVTLRAAADTNTRAEVCIVRTPAVVVLPQVAPKIQPSSATQSLPQTQDPHPFVTEFFGPAPQAKAAPQPEAKPDRQAQLTPAMDKNDK